jgi:hypothetical protein
VAEVDAAAAAFGLVVAAVGLTKEQELWPENETAVRLFDAMLSQWRFGPGGPAGLDYAALPVVARQLRLKRRALREAFDGLRVMEGEALRWFGERRR